VSVVVEGCGLWVAGGGAGGGGRMVVGVEAGASSMHAATVGMSVHKGLAGQSL